MHDHEDGEHLDLGHGATVHLTIEAPHTEEAALRREAAALQTEEVYASTAHVPCSLIGVMDANGGGHVGFRTGIPLPPGSTVVVGGTGPSGIVICGYDY